MRKKNVAKNKTAASSTSSSGNRSRAGRPLKVILKSTRSTRSTTRKRVASESVSLEVSNEDVNVSTSSSASKRPRTTNTTTSGSNQASNFAPIFGPRAQPTAELDETSLEAVTNNLEHIMQRLNNPKDLQNCRLVTKAWRNQATDELLTRNCCRIVLEYREDKSKHYRFGSRGMVSYFEKLSMEALTNLMSSSPKFPCSEFFLTWARFDSVVDNDLENFFTVAGSTIKTLFIHPRLCRLSHICKMLMKAPNMTKLKISGLCNVQDDEEVDANNIEMLENVQEDASSSSSTVGREPIKISLPSSITSIEFCNTYPTSKKKIVENILVAAATASDNLEFVHGLTHHDFDLLSKLDMVHVLKSWATWLTPFDLSDIDPLTRDPINLQKLAICASQNQIEGEGTAFIKILNHNSDSLEELEWSPMRYDQGTTLSTLGKLKTLIITPLIQGGGNGGQRERYFPTNTNLTTTFPKLKAIIFLDFADNQNGVDFGWANHFPDEPIIGTVEGTFSSVTRLNFHGRSGTGNFLHVLRPLCPSVERIKLDHPNHFSNNRDELGLMFSEIFGSWKNLQALQLTVGELRVNLAHYFSMGLSPEDCEWLSRSALQHRLVENGMLPGPWVGYFRGFTQWTVSGNPLQFGPVDNNPKPSFGVTIKYPNGIRITNPKLQQALDSLAPFVTIDTNNIA